MKTKTPLYIALTILLSICILAASLGFGKNFTSVLQNNANDRLNDVVTPNIVSFHMQVADQVQKVRMIADILSNTGQLGDLQQQKILQAAVENNGLLRCAIAFPDGTYVTNNIAENSANASGTANVSNEDFFIASMKGEFYITDPCPAVVDHSKTVILFSCPIEKDGEIVGVVIYSYLCDDIDKFFNLQVLEGQGQMMVIKENGQRLIGHTRLFPDSENPLTYLRSNCTHQFHNPSDCMKLDSPHDIMALTLQGMNDRLLVSCDRLDYNDWYMLSIVPEKAASQILSDVSLAQRNLAVFIALCFAIYLTLMFLIWLTHRHNRDRMTKALTMDSFKQKARKILYSKTNVPYVFVKLDVKNFKLINRIYDFSVGDQVIKNIALSFEYVLQGLPALFARVGTDDFLLLIPYDNRDRLDGQRAAFIEKFRELMGRSFTTRVEFPTGQYLLTEKDYPKPDIDEILEKVNFAHRAAKQKDWGVIVDYVENLEKNALLEKDIEDKMSSALSNEEFQLYLQPKYSVATERVVGAEALARWESEGEIYMHPMSFIPILERNGFIVKIDMYMFERAAEYIRSMIDKGIPPITISVNFSRVHLYNEHFVGQLCEIADRYHVPHQYLEVELTESAVFENLQRIVGLIDKLHTAGFTLSMDDFGSGYSCLALLKDLDVDVVKLDKAFFDETTDTERAYIVVSNIMHMAKELNVTTVAEGIETRQQVEMLQSLGCDMIQGFYYSKPVPASQFVPDDERSRS